MRARAERAAGIDHDGRAGPAAGSPRAARPTASRRPSRPVWKARQPSSQPSATGSSLHVPVDLRQPRRAIRAVDGELELAARRRAAPRRPPRTSRALLRARSPRPRRRARTRARAGSPEGPPQPIAQTPARAFGLRVVALCPRAPGSARRRVRCSSSSARGTCTFAIRRRSPRAPPRRRGMPWPLSTITVPGCSPASISTCSSPSSVSTVARDAEHGLREPQVELPDEVEPVAHEALVRAARGRAGRDRRPARPARRRARGRSAAPPARRRCPAGISTPELHAAAAAGRGRGSRGTGCSGMRPRPAHLRHGALRMSCPSGERTTWRTWPAPSHSLHVSTSAPGAAPSPSQTSQVRDELEIEVDVHAARGLGEVDLDRGLRIGARLGPGRAREAAAEERAEQVVEEPEVHEAARCGSPARPRPRARSGRSARAARRRRAPRRPRRPRGSAPRRPAPPTRRDAARARGRERPS